MNGSRNLMVNNNLETVTANFSIPASSLLDKIHRREDPPGVVLPTTTNQLTGTYVKEHLYTFQTASALGIAFGGVSADFKQDSEDKVFVWEVLKYCDFHDTAKNLTIRYGVGIRIIYQLRILNIEADVSSLPMILASAQFKYLNANVEVRALGTPTFPVPTGLTSSLESYDAIKKTMEDWKTLINKSDSPIHPEILSISYRDPSVDVISSYQNVGAQCFALKMIKKGYSREKAMGKCLNAPLSFQTAVAHVYEDFKQMDTNVAAVYANNALKNLSVMYHDKW